MKKIEKFCILMDGKIFTQFNGNIWLFVFQNMVIFHLQDFQILSEVMPSHQFHQVLKQDIISFN